MITIIEPREFHRLGIAVDDVPSAREWLERILGGVAPSIGRLDMFPGMDSQMVTAGSWPLFLMQGGPVARFLERRGPSVHSYAWMVDDNWETEHFVRDQGIEITGVNIDARLFYMHPKQTNGLLVEWCSTHPTRHRREAAAPRPEPDPGGPGLVGVREMAWSTAVVNDADATATWLERLVHAERVDGNPCGPAAQERTIDLLVGGIVVRLVSPTSSDSRYARALEEGGARILSFTVRVDDLDAALATLEAEGVPTVYREGSLAATDPKTTLGGVHIDWTQ